MGSVGRAYGCACYPHARRIGEQSLYDRILLDVNHSFYANLRIMIISFNEPSARCCADEGLS